MNTCACCGNRVPKGRQFCSGCETWSIAPDAFLEDGTPVYLKTPTNPTWGSIQLELYQQLMNYRAAVDKED